MKHRSFISFTAKAAALVAITGGIFLLGSYLFFDADVAFWGKDGERAALRHAARGEDEVLTIGYALAPADLEPTRFDPVTRSYLMNIYEGLVTTDRDLNVKPGIAVSWGMIDDMTWEFRLRPGVLFHNGQEVGIGDVMASIERAVTYDGSQLGNLLNTVAEVEEAGDGRLRILTRAPDPLLLQKLAVVSIFPGGQETFGQPVGTGPYKVESYNGGEMRLVRFAEYWGRQPAFHRVVLRSIPDRHDRVDALNDGEIDLLTNTPPTAACSQVTQYSAAEGCLGFSATDIVVKAVPSLEVGYLALNLKNVLLKQDVVREALRKSFDSEIFVDLSYGFARVADQFVSSGVFGFDPGIEAKSYDIVAAKAMVASVLDNELERPVLLFDYVEGLDSLAQYVRGQMGQLGIDVALNPVSDAELQEKIALGSSDMFFIGWRSELGDASDFLQAVAHTRDTGEGYGLFNGGNYSNVQVDGLIEASQLELDQGKRLEYMQKAMKTLVSDDIMGIPLFEADTLFAYQNHLIFEPRVDGYVVAAEIQ